MEEILDILMARASHRPLSRPLSAGVAVMTPRGYGVVVAAYNATGDRYTRNGIGWGTRAQLIVELDDTGQRTSFYADQLHVVEDAPITRDVDG